MGHKNACRNTLRLTLLSEDTSARGNVPILLQLSTQDTWVIFWTLFALLVVRVGMMIWMPFTDTTKARYTDMARMMVETGDWITSQIEYGVPFWGKPPLHTWLSAFGIKLFGAGDFGPRVFILASALTVLWLIFLWAQTARELATALISIMVTTSTLLFLVASAFVMTDMLMVLGTTLSMTGFYTCTTATSRRLVWGYLFFVGLAVGVPAKGPIAIVLTTLPIGLWVLLENRCNKLGNLA